MIDREDPGIGNREAAEMDPRSHCGPAIEQFLSGLQIKGFQDSGVAGLHTLFGAAALHFVTDATKVVAASNPTYKPTQKCGNCAQYQGKAGDAAAGCNIFAGKSVPAGGWCMVWVQKTG